MIDINEIFRIFSPLSRVLPTGENIAKTFEDIIGGTTRINQTFTQSRQRVHEFSQAIADTIPMVNRLGGTSDEVVNLIDTVAKTTKRNVVATGEEITKIFAASKLSGIEAAKLIETYQNIGIQFSQIGTSMEKSIGYIQSVGGNARDILKGMEDSIQNLNRFSFQDGVLGLTRMATQAQLLKFDMEKTLSFADKVLSPEKAIEMASAFQRMGVSVGTLTDPFQLMNKALTDPEGLQNSIVEMTKQFTYFDEQANQFKINPQGMLMLRELGQQIDIDSKELSKMAINASELDRRLSQISPSFEFENEEDRQYIANIAKMGTGGQYEITLTDEKDKSKNRTVLLQEASNEELKQLVELQRSQSAKTLEDLQREQIGILNKLYGVFDAEKNKFIGGFASSKVLTDTLSTGKYIDSLIKSLEKFAAENLKIGSTAQNREKANQTITSAKPVINLLLGETKDMIESLTPFFNEAKSKLTELMKEVPKSLINAIDKIERRTGGDVPDSLEEFLKKLTTYTKPITETESFNTRDFNVKNFNLPDTGYGKHASYIPSAELPNSGKDLEIYKFASMKTMQSKIEFGSLPALKIIFSKEPGFDYNTNKFEEIFISKLSDTQFVQKIVSAIQPQVEEYQSKTKYGVPS